jgi:hypothetical protein
MIAGVDAAQIARDYHLPHRAALNHRRYHLPRLLQKVHEGAQAVEAGELRKMLVQIGADFQKLFEEFMKAKDHRAALIAREKMLGWWSVAAKSLGIDQPPEGQREPQSPETIAQAARDIFGIIEMPGLGEDAQRALPAPEDEQAPEAQAAPEPATPAPTPAPAQSMADRYRRTSAEIVGHREPGLKLNVEEKIRRATPVKNLYQEQLDRIHAQGRRAEVGELSPKPGNTT